MLSVSVSELHMERQQNTKTQLSNFMIAKSLENLLCLTALKTVKVVIASKIYLNVDYNLHLFQTEQENSIQVVLLQNQCTQHTPLLLGVQLLITITISSLISTQKLRWVLNKIFSAFLRVDLTMFYLPCSGILHWTMYHQMQWLTLWLQIQNGPILKIVELSHALVHSTFFSRS